MKSAQPSLLDHTQEQLWSVNKVDTQDGWAFFNVQVNCLDEVRATGSGPLAEGTDEFLVTLQFPW